MLPYARSRFLEDHYKQIADDPKASVKNKLEALKGLNKLRLEKRHLGPRKKKLSRLLGAVPGDEKPVVPAPAGDSSAPRQYGDKYQTYTVLTPGPEAGE